MRNSTAGLLRVMAPTTVLALTLVLSPLPSGVAGNLDPRFDGDGIVVTEAAAPAWLAASDLSEASQDANVPQVALDPAGNAIVVWTRWNGTNWIVQAAARPAGGSWEPAVDLSQTGQDAYDPEVARDGAGNAIAVWRRWDGGNWIVQAAARPVGGSWQSPVDLSQAGYDAHQPRIALDPAGNAIAVWRRNMPNSVVQAAFRPAGGSWQSAVDLSQAAGHDAFSPQVALDPAGNAVAVWRRYEPPSVDSIVQAATRQAGGSWQPALDLSQAGQSAFWPQVALDPAGNTLVVWERSNGSNEIVQAAARPAGGSWQSAVDLSQAGENAHQPRVALDPAGNAVAVWYRFNGSNDIVQAATRLAGGSWQPAVNLSQTGQSSLWAEVAVDPAGNALAVWERSNGSNEIVQGAAYDAAGPVMRGLSIPATGTVGAPLQVAVDPFDVWSALIGQPAWSFGDGAMASGASVSHAYGAPGTYTVSVQQGDALGNTSTASRQVSINAPPPPPPPPPLLPTPPPPPAQAARCVVPNVKGKTVARAKAVLRARRCAPGGIKYAFHRTIKKGRVIAQSKRPGTRHPRNTKVRLIVSKGRRSTRR